MRDRWAVLIPKKSYGSSFAAATASNGCEKIGRFLCRWRESQWNAGARLHRGRIFGRRRCPICRSNHDVFALAPQGQAALERDRAAARRTGTCTRSWLAFAKNHSDQRTHRDTHAALFRRDETLLSPPSLCAEVLISVGVSVDMRMRVWSQAYEKCQNYGENSRQIRERNERCAPG